MIGVAEGIRPAQVARLLRVSAKSAYQWRQRWRSGGPLPPDVPAARGATMRVEHEYVRHGALALLAALDVHTGKSSPPPPTPPASSRSWT